MIEIVFALDILLFIILGALYGRYKWVKNIYYHKIYHIKRILNQSNDFKSEVITKKHFEDKGFIEVSKPSLVEGFLENYYYRQAYKDLNNFELKIKVVFGIVALAFLLITFYLLFFHFEETVTIINK